LEDGLIARYWPRIVRAALARWLCKEHHLPAWLGKVIADWPQKAEDRRQRLERKMLLEVDDRAEKRLSFAGRGE
jgi:hypothetical protein